MNDSIIFRIRLSLQTLAGIGGVLAFIRVLKMIFHLLISAKCDLLQLGLFIFLYVFCVWVFYQLETKN